MFLLKIPRRFVPKMFRKDNKFHDLSHSGIKATVKLIKIRSVWTKTNKILKNAHKA